MPRRYLAIFQNVNGRSPWQDSKLLVSSKLTKNTCPSHIIHVLSPSSFLKLHLHVHDASYLTRSLDFMKLSFDLSRINIAVTQWTLQNITEIKSDPSFTFLVNRLTCVTITFHEKPWCSTKSERFQFTLRNHSCFWNSKISPHISPSIHRCLSGLKKHIKFRL